MRFKEKRAHKERGDVYVFGDGYDSELLEMHCPAGMWFIFRGVMIDKDLMIAAGVVTFTDIQIAVNLMKILIDEGYVDA